MNIVPVSTLLRKNTGGAPSAALEGGHSAAAQATQLSVVVMHFAEEAIPRQRVSFTVNLVTAITQQFGGVVMPLLGSTPQPSSSDACDAIGGVDDASGLSQVPRVRPSPRPSASHAQAANRSADRVAFARRAASATDLRLTVDAPRFAGFETPAPAASVALVFNSASAACTCASTIQLACEYALANSAEDAGVDAGDGIGSEKTPKQRERRSPSRARPTFAMLMHSCAPDELLVRRQHGGIASRPGDWMGTGTPSSTSAAADEGDDKDGAGRVRRLDDGRRGATNALLRWSSGFALVGAGAEEAALLATMVNEGQVVLTEPAWKQLQVSVPPRVSLLSLGRHLIRPDLAFDLMQATPSVSVEKRFPPLGTVAQLTPGYFDSPDSARGVAIVFCRAPAQCTAPEVSQWAAICREACEASSGYECKEPDPGKFTLAFHTFADALLFGTRAHAGAKRAGLRVCIGSAFGKDLFRKPLGASGRADYFGSTANLAARIMGQAHPGQMVVELTGPPEQYGLSAAMHRDTPGGGVWKMVVPRIVGEGGGDAWPGAIRLSGVGMISLKGVSRPVVCVQVNAWDDDDDVTFPPPKGWTSDVAGFAANSRNSTFARPHAPGRPVTSRRSFTWSTI